MESRRNYDPGTDSEQRKAPRTQSHIGIQVQAVRATTDPATEDGSAALRLAGDISRNGLRFTDGEALPAGSELLIRVPLDMPRKIITHKGVVRWARKLSPDQPFSLGVEFTETDALEQETWSAFVDAQARSAH
jgi:hypothetical protein